MMGYHGVLINEACKRSETTYSSSHCIVGSDYAGLGVSNVVGKLQSCSSDGRIRGNRIVDQTTLLCYINEKSPIRSRESIPKLDLEDKS